jgi:hypothetical protein
MQINARVISESNGAPVPDAQILYTDASGNWQVAMRADENGYFAGSFPDISPDIMVSAPGYASSIMDQGEVADQMKVQLKESPLAGPSLTTIQKNVTASSIPVWVWVAGGAGIFYLAAQPAGRGKVSGQGQDYSKYILPVGIVVAGVLVLNKVFGLFGKDTGTGQNNQAVTDTIAATTKKTLADLSARGINPTLPVAQAAGIANDIFYTGLNGGSSGIPDIFADINQARNDADIYLIMQQFGARKVASSDWSLCSLANINCDAVDLHTFVTSILNNYNVPYFTVQDLNAQLQDIGYAINRGITYQF